LEPLTLKANPLQAIENEEYKIYYKSQKDTDKAIIKNIADKNSYSPRNYGTFLDNNNDGTCDECENLQNDHSISICFNNGFDNTVNKLRCDVCDIINLYPHNCATFNENVRTDGLCDECGKYYIEYVCHNLQDSNNDDTCDNCHINYIIYTHPDHNYINVNNTNICDYCGNPKTPHVRDMCPLIVGSPLIIKSQSNVYYEYDTEKMAYIYYPGFIPGDGGWGYITVSGDALYIDVDDNGTPIYLTLPRIDLLENKTAYYIK
jgi:hypothetical protein